MTVTMDTLINYSKKYGFVFQGSAIYGGLANTWDYGPLGVELKKNLKDTWWQRFVQERRNVVGLDSSILLNPKTWEASGHFDQFNDPLIDCKACKSRFRADKMIEEHDASIDADGLDSDTLEKVIEDRNIPCPSCGAHDFTKIRRFNLMFETSQGVVDEKKDSIYLRPETAQGIFLDFKEVQRATRMKVPFGIAQSGKSFRNEITPGNFIFRTREFEQMEIEFFCEPDTSKDWFNAWKKDSMQYLYDIGLPEASLRFSDHPEEKLSHYSDATTDIEYKFPWGFDEMWGIASRTDFDLTQHQNHSGEKLHYQDPVTNEKYIPYVIEPSLGVERLFLAVLANAYEEEALEDGQTRTVLKLHPALAPYKVAVLPLIKKRHREEAHRIQDKLSKRFMTTYDEAGQIGRRYRRQDAVGTPFAVTIDDDTLENGTYTVRNRDTMKQVTLKEDELVEYIQNSIDF